MRAAIEPMGSGTGRARAVTESAERSLGPAFVLGGRSTGLRAVTRTVLNRLGGSGRDRANVFSD